MGKKRQVKVLTKPAYEKTRRIEYPVLVLLVIGAFLLRVVGQLDKVFVGGNVWFRGVDSWYHMRLADITTNNFPYFMSFDRFAIYPSGHEVGYMPLLSWLVAIPGQVWNHEVVAAYLPPVLGALTLIPVYLIGREVFNGRVGLLACLLVAALPGEFLHRSLLGFTDHHFLESLLMATTLLFFLYSYRTMKLRWSILAGVSLSLYHLAWAGTSYLILILGVWTWFEFLRRFKKNEDIYSLCKTVSVPVGIGLLVAFPFLSSQARLISVGILSVSVGLWILTKYVKDREQILFALTALVPIGLTIVGFFYSWHNLLVTFFWKGGTTVQEVGWLTPNVLFATYGISFLLMIGGLWFCPKNRFTGLFLIWSLILIASSLGQRRWGYYTVIPVSLLASYFTFTVTQWVKPQVRIAVTVVIIAFLLLPNVNNTIRLAQIPNNIYANWYVALTWLEKNTPNPFTTKNAYHEFELEEKTQYGVLSWWDYGHWIIRIAKRVPTDSPTLTSSLDARFFTTKTEEEAKEVLKNSNIRYVIIDQTLVSGKWYAIARRGGDEGMNVRESMLYKLWTDESTSWTKVFERGDVKVYERNDS